MKSIVECITTETDFVIHREEESKEITFTNSDYKLVCDIVEIEKCVFYKVVGGKRCDYLFLFDKNRQEYKFLDKSQAFYIELKGEGELVKAAEQLFNSIENTKDQTANFDINAVVVSSREFNPKYDNNEFYRNVYRLIKKKIQFEVTPYTKIL